MSLKLIRPCLNKKYLINIKGIQLSLQNIAKCMCDYRRGFGLEIEFIDHLQILTTKHCSTIDNSHTLHITTAQARSFHSLFTTSFLVTNLQNRDSSTAPTKSSLHRLPYN
jgi:hypothetical protein